MEQNEQNEEPQVEETDSFEGSEAQQVFLHDPFGPQPGAPEVEETPPAVVPSQAPPPVEAQPQPQPQPQPSDEARQLREMVARQQQIIERMAEAVRQPQQPQQPAQPQTEKPEFEVPPYEFQVQDQLIEALGHEDANIRKLGISALARATAQEVHRQVMQQVVGRFKDFDKSLDGRIGARVTQTQTRESMQSDFFGAYPALQNPAFSSVVAAATEQAVQELGTSTWTPQMRDLIGQRAMQMLVAAVPGHAAAAPPQAPMVPAQPAPQPPAMFAPGARPNGSGKPRKQVDEVWDTLFGE